MMRRHDRYDTVFNFLYNALAGVFFLLFAGFMIWIIYAQDQATRLKTPTCAEAVRVCVASNGGECQHINQYCETRAPMLERANDIAEKHQGVK